MMKNRCSAYWGIQIVVCFFVLVNLPQFCAFTQTAEMNAYKWVQVTSSAPWAPRSGHAAVVFHDKLWVMGGETNGYNDMLNDVWSSSDGIQWEKIVENAPWSGCILEHTVVVFDDKIWIMGSNFLSNPNNIWYSSDGTNWKQPDSYTIWPSRYSYVVTAFQGSIWMYGGIEHGYACNDSWKSTDGSYWVLLTPQNDWAVRSAHTVTTFKDKLWLSGGRKYLPGSSCGEDLNDCWYTSDGVNWSSSILNAKWSKRSLHVMVSYCDKLWIMGGSYVPGCYPGSSTMFFNDVWSSVDGTEWEQMPDAPWAKRADHAGIEFNGKLWILGGDGGKEFNDVWYMEKETQEPDVCITPESSQKLTGPVGGPFNPGVVTYTLANIGTSDLQYTVSQSAEWLGLRLPGTTDGAHSLDVTVPAQGSVSVEAFPSTTANTLQLGIYADTLYFNDTPLNAPQTREITLTITEPSTEGEGEPSEGEGEASEGEGEASEGEGEVSEGEGEGSEGIGEVSEGEGEASEGEGSSSSGCFVKIL